VVASLLLFGLLAGGAWLLLRPSPNDREILQGFAWVAQRLLPPASRAAPELQQSVERIARHFDADISIYSPTGRRLASGGRPVPLPLDRRGENRWFHARGHGFVLSLVLDDGRIVVGRHHRGLSGWGWLVAVAALSSAVTIGAYPVVRRITRRLERLQQRVDALGRGELSARVEVEGRDEVAALARSFNRAADRIERLVQAQRDLLAGASHELRSPLARMRVAIELLAGGQRPELHAQLVRDIAQLDELIEELLVASRLRTVEELQRGEQVDLLALAAEEAAGGGAAVTGEPVTIVGDPRLLRRMIRNLLDNGRRHAGGSAVEVEVRRRPSGARLTVADRGPGIPAAERDRVFEPFYRLSGATGDGSTGIGLGLSLVRQIARHHGGDIQCLPRAGGGTCFVVELAGLPSTGAPATT
jgi:signal transduction histidine kinase